MLVFDIGANLGSFTRAFLEKYNGVHMILVEPNDELYSHLVNLFRGNSNVTVLNYAASSKNEVIPFYKANSHTISTCSRDWIENSRFSSGYKWSEPTDIPSITIDSLIEKYGEPDLVKIDVEGYEYEVALGLTKKVKKLCFEWAEEQKEAICNTIDYLKSLGFTEIGYLEGDSYLEEPKEYVPFDQFYLMKELDSNRKERWGMIFVK